MSKKVKKKFEISPMKARWCMCGGIFEDHIIAAQEDIDGIIYTRPNQCVHAFLCMCEKFRPARRPK